MSSQYISRLEERADRELALMRSLAAEKPKRTAPAEARGERGEPEPLRRPLPDAAAYPMEALGPILEPAARALLGVVQAPDAVIGASLLAAASLAAQPHADVHVDGRRSPISLWHVTIAESGERKSAVDNWALQAHREAERESGATFRSDMTAYRGECHRPPLWSHSGIAVMEPVDDRRYGARRGSA